MRHHDNVRSLFQLQVELVDSKVDTAVNKAISQVVDQIVSLKHEMHREIGDLSHKVHREISGLSGEVSRDIGSLRHEMYDLKHEMGSRLSSVETGLGMRKEVRGEVRKRIFDYAFQAGWIILCSALTYAALHFHSVF